MLIVKKDNGLRAIMMIGLSLCPLLLTSSCSTTPITSNQTAGILVEAYILNLQAGSYYQQGRYDEAGPLYQRSLAISEKALGPEHPDVAQSLNDLGLLYKAQGRYDEAESLYQRSLAIREQALGPEHPDVATSLNNLAALYHDQGRYDEAEPLYQRSLAIRETALGPEHPDVALSLNNLAALYHEQGRYDEAEPLYQRSLAISEKALGPEHPGVALALNNLANLYHNQGRYDEAEPLYQRSLAIREQALGSEHPLVALSLHNLANLYNDQGRYDEAEPLYQRSLAIWEKALGPEHPHVATILNNLANLYNHQGRYDQAGPLLQRAVRIITAYPTLLPLQAAIKHHFAWSYARQAHDGMAVFYQKQAVNAIQQLRGQLSDGSKLGQQAFLADKKEVYNDLANLLIQQGRIPEAEQVLAMLKEEEAFTYIRRNPSVGVDQSQLGYTQDEQYAQDKLQALENSIIGVAQERDRLWQLTAPTPQQQERMEELEARLDEHQQKFSALMTELIQYFAQADQQQRTEVTEMDLALLQDTQGLLQKMGAGTVQISTLPTQDTLHLIVTTGQVQVARQVAISAAELNRLITEYRSVLQTPGLDPRATGKRLYDLLIQPIKADLEQAKAQTLMWNQYGSLRYIPMPALYDGQEYLVEHYANVLYTPAARDNLGDPAIANWRVAGMGVSQAHDNDQVGHFSALPYVSAELDGIVKTDATDRIGVIEGSEVLDTRFTKHSLKAVIGQHRHPVLHIASHFNMVPGNDDASFLLLGDGTPLRMSEFNTAYAYNLANIDLLTLSACNTAVTGDGSEIESFAAVAQARGANSVLATLWPVADESTQLFMRELYSRKIQKGLNKAQALREAQLALMTSDYSPGEISTRGRKDDPDHSRNPADKDFSHPYYWAPFVLMGNWL